MSIAYGDYVEGRMFPCHEILFMAKITEKLSEMHVIFWKENSLGRAFTRQITNQNSNLFLVTILSQCIWKYDLRPTLHLLLVHPKDLKTHIGSH